MLEYTDVEQRNIINKLNESKKNILHYIKYEDCDRINFNILSYKELLTIIFSDNNNDFTLRDIRRLLLILEKRISKKDLSEDIIKNIEWCKSYCPFWRKPNIYRWDANDKLIKYNDYIYENDLEKIKKEVKDYDKSTCWIIDNIVPDEYFDELEINKFLDWFNKLFNVHAESLKTFEDFDEGNKIFIECKIEVNKYKNAVFVLKCDTLTVFEFVRLFKMYLDLKYIDNN